MVTTFVLSAALVMASILYTRSWFFSTQVVPDGCTVYPFDRIDVTVAKAMPIIIWTVLVQILPWFIEMTLCIRVIVLLRKANSFRHQFQRNAQTPGFISPGELKLSATLVVSCLSHIGCSFPEISFFMTFLIGSWAALLPFIQISYYINLCAPSLMMVFSVPATIQYTKELLGRMRHVVMNAAQAMSSWLSSTTNSTLATTQSPIEA